MIKDRLLILTFIIAVIYCFCVSSNKITKLPWYRYYSNYQLDSAEIALKKYLSKNPKDLKSLSYYAETLRRLKKNILADSITNFILNLDQCNSHAFYTKGDIANSQYGKGQFLNEDSAFFYYLKAIECDSTNGNAWEVIWIKAMKKDDTQLENMALKKLYKTGFYTKCAISYARWFLSDLPENAILLTNGDMDTYPLLTLQKNEDFRSDVAVINVSMLNMKWYFKFVCNRYNIPTGFTFNELEHFKRKGKDDGSVSINKQILSKWYELFNLKKLSRPLCFAITVEENYLKPFNKRMELHGPFYKLLVDTVTRKGDPIALFNSLKKINPNDFTGPFIGERVTSPILLEVKHSRRFDANVLATAIFAASEFSKVSMDSSAYEVLDCIDNYLDVVDGKQKYRDLSSRCRKEVMNGKYRKK